MASSGHVAVIGGGIVGVALAEQLSRSLSVVLVEKEPALAQHQTAHNSGVVHMGVYYEPGSLKARLCRRGGDLLKAFCAAQGLAYEEVGKVVVATEQSEVPALRALFDRSRQNGVPDVALIDAAKLKAVEPLARGVAALHSPHTAIVDFPTVTRKLAAVAQERGAVVRLGFPVAEIRPSSSRVVLVGPGGEIAADRVVVCAGLQADRLARGAGDDPTPAIVPFLGEYYELGGEPAAGVRGLIYPVPDPRYPFLGIHLTRRLDGTVWVGPNAVVGMARERYRKWRIDRIDLAEMLRFRGFWRMARTHWRAGARELAGSGSRVVFAHAARRYVPTIGFSDLARGPVGIRAQAVGADGELIDDFLLSRQGRVVSERNAPSPGATSALALAEHVAGALAG